MNIIKNIILSSAILSAGFITLAHAEKVPTIFSGSGLEVDYSDHGLWNNSATGQGLEFNGTPISYPGRPWQQVSIAYNGSVQKLGNFLHHEWDLQVPIVGHTSGSGFGNVGSTTVWNAGDLRIMKEESWHENGHVMKIDVTVTNECCEDVKDFVFMHAVDPDQDIADFGDNRTLNDVVPSQNFVMSAGLKSGLTTSYGVCDSKKQDIGHTNWNPSPYNAFTDQNFSLKDDTMHIRHREPLIKAGETVRFTFMFYVSDGIISAFHDYNNYVKKVCDCELKLTSRKYISLAESDEISSLDKVLAGAYEEDFAYILKREEQLKKIRNLRATGKPMGIKIGPSVKQGHLYK
ncbi:MAG: hypothetical protein L3J88_05120 [Gammaproteobacteria bacterium]|nr:hypothetical protein [Gammaproteobacteria bacterium]